MLSIRYSAAAATKPRVAKYPAVLANCAGLPVAQLPPKKKTIAVVVFTIVIIALASFKMYYVRDDGGVDGRNLKGIYF